MDAEQRARVAHMLEMDSWWLCGSDVDDFRALLAAYDAAVAQLEDEQSARIKAQSLTLVARMCVADLGAHCRDIEHALATLVGEEETDA